MTNLELMNETLEPVRQRLLQDTWIDRDEQVRDEVAVERHRADAVMTVRGMESLVVSDEHDGARALPTRNFRTQRTNVSPGARFLSRKPLPRRRLLAGRERRK